MYSLTGVWFILCTVTFNCVYCTVYLCVLNRLPVRTVLFTCLNCTVYLCVLYHLPVCTVSFTCMYCTVYLCHVCTVSFTCVYCTVYLCVQYRLPVRTVPFTCVYYLSVCSVPFTCAVQFALAGWKSVQYFKWIGAFSAVHHNVKRFFNDIIKLWRKWFCSKLKS